MKTRKIWEFTGQALKICGFDNRILKRNGSYKYGFTVKSWNENWDHLFAHFDYSRSYVY